MQRCALRRRRLLVTAGRCVTDQISMASGLPGFSAAVHNIVSRRSFSDNLLGHSPMAQPVPKQTPSGSSKIVTAKDVTTMGGVWAPTSAKRDKLTELRANLEEGQTSLDDAATPEQRLDLNLADGLGAIFKTVDSLAVSSSSSQEDANASTLADICQWMDQRSKDFGEELSSAEWNNFLTAVIQKVEMNLPLAIDDKYLRLVRDIMEPPADASSEADVAEGVAKSVDVDVDNAFQTAILYYRLHLIQATAQHLMDSWERLVTVSDADIDRAATKDTVLDKKASTLRTESCAAVLRSYAEDTCSGRVDAWWALMDRDGDGLLDQAEMNVVCEMAVAPVFAASNKLLEASIKAYPTRLPLQENAMESDESPTPNGWRARRSERNVQKRLLRLYAKTTKNHFLAEVEMPHRLRCIYAWAEKNHQDNKIESVLVDHGGFAGRKRYVELEPKISLAEFREVQQEHFTHLDRVGEELIKSYREELLIDQGRGRERRELLINGTAFLAGVSLIDVVIGLI